MVNTDLSEETSFRDKLWSDQVQDHEEEELRPSQRVWIIVDFLMWQLRLCENAKTKERSS